MKSKLIIFLTPLLLIASCNSGEITSTSSSSSSSTPPISYGDGRRVEYGTLNELVSDFPVDFSIDDYQYAIPIFDEPTDGQPSLPYFVADSYAYYDDSQQKQYTRPTLTGSGFITSLFGTRQIGFYATDSSEANIDFALGFRIETKISDDWIDIYYYQYSVFIIKVYSMGDNSDINVAMIKEFIHDHVMLFSNTD